MVGIVARLSPVKDHGTLLRAIASLREQIPALHCVLIGDGPERSAIEGLAESLGIREIVHLAGERSQPPNLHGLFDVSVLCSTSEAFPNSVLEAMAAARPVVATDVGGTPDAIRQGTTGLLVPPSDPSRLAEAILRLHEEPALRTKLGNAGCAAARWRVQLGGGDRPGRGVVHQARRPESGMTTPDRPVGAGLAGGGLWPAHIPRPCGARSGDDRSAGRIGRRAAPGSVVGAMAVARRAVVAHVRRLSRIHLRDHDVPHPDRRRLDRDRPHRSVDDEGADPGAGAVEGPRDLPPLGHHRMGRERLPLPGVSPARDDGEAVADRARGGERAAHATADSLLPLLLAGLLRVVSGPRRAVQLLPVW